MIGVCDCALRNPRVRALNVYKELSKTRSRAPLSDVLLYIRKIGADWMEKNAGCIMWEGMRYRDLALMMANNPDVSYGVHVASMRADCEWIDASMLHALCCVFSVDAAVFQPVGDPMFVGRSMEGDKAGAHQGGALDTIAIALANDKHWWGVTVITDHRLHDLSLERGDILRMPRPEVGHCLGCPLKSKRWCVQVWMFT